MKYALVTLTILGVADATAQKLPRSTPEEQGLSSTAILNFVKSAEEKFDALHSFVLLRHGQVVAEGWWYPYSAEQRHRLYSLSKSFTATGVGLAIDAGALSLEDLVLDYFPKDLNVIPHRNLQAMRIRDLLIMSTGHMHDTIDDMFSDGDMPWVETFLALPVEYKPGTHFTTNLGATYMLAAILQRATGENIVDYLQPRLFEPLGIKGYYWQESPQGISAGGWGLRLKTEDLARFGQLYLQKGMWDGERILSEEWIKTATMLQTSTGSDPYSDWEQGYGYHFWLGRHNTYHSDGDFGQFCIVMPEQDTVLALTGGVASYKTQDILNLVWDYLLPALQPDSLAADKQAHAALSDKLSFLFLKPLRGASYVPKAKEISGQLFEFADNHQGVEAISFDFGRGGNAFTIHDQQGKHLIKVGHGTWLKGETAYETQSVTEPIATSGGWTDNEVFMAQIFFTETAHSAKLEFDFSEGRLRFDFGYNVAFGMVRRPQLISE